MLSLKGVGISFTLAKKFMGIFGTTSIPKGTPSLITGWLSLETIILLASSASLTMASPKTY
jgi:heme/copper-type cytochrome/quinol oxidase subunit 3